jgi:hypothetical protein
MAETISTHRGYTILKDERGYYCDRFESYNRFATAWDVVCVIDEHLSP